MLPSSTTIQVTTTTEDSEGTGVACHMNCTRKFAGRSHSKEARNCFFDCEETTGTSGTTTVSKFCAFDKKTKLIKKIFLSIFPLLLTFRKNGDFSGHEVRYLK